MTLSKQRMTVAIGTLTIIVISALLWLFVLSPQFSKASEIQAETETVQAANTKLTHTINAIEEQRANLAEQRVFAAALAARFPATAAQAEMFAQIRAAAEQAGIPERNVSTLTPSAPENVVVAAPKKKTTTEKPDSKAADTAEDPSKDVKAPKPGSATVKKDPATGLGVAKLSIGLTAVGSTTQLGNFLEALETMDRAFLIDTLALGPAGTEAGNEFTLTLTGTMFAMQAPTDPDAPVAAAEDASTAPSGTPPTPTPTTTEPTTTEPTDTPEPTPTSTSDDETAPTSAITPTPTTN